MLLQKRQQLIYVVHKLQERNKDAIMIYST